MEEVRAQVSVKRTAPSDAVEGTLPDSAVPRASTSPQEEERDVDIWSKREAAALDETPPLEEAEEKDGSDAAEGGEEEAAQDFHACQKVGAPPLDACCRECGLSLEDIQTTALEMMSRGAKGEEVSAFLKKRLGPRRLCCRALCLGRHPAMALAVGRLSEPGAAGGVKGPRHGATHTAGRGIPPTLPVPLDGAVEEREGGGCTVY
jgi:hypothetical protein